MKKYEQTNSFSGELVKYYDMFFNIEENAPKHIEYMKSIIGDEWEQLHTIWDIGCGTGKHIEILENQGKDVFGLDCSEDMIDFAKKRNNVNGAQFVNADIRYFVSNHKFDMAYAMSHVIGYQLNNADVENMLNAIWNGLKDNGLFFFNFYSLSGVYNSNLVARRQIKKSDDCTITRFSNANILGLENVLQLDYNYLIEDIEKDDLTYITIQEKMRCFSLLELTYFLEKCGFKIERITNFGADSELTANDWNGCILARKINR